jgi:glycosyltransferase XagB
MASMRAFPDRSAKARLALWQRLLLFLLLAGFGAALVLQAEPAFRALSLALIFIFLPVIALRVFAAYDLLRRAPSKPARPRVPDAELPLYTILVPLYREANMLAPLTAALARLDYPAAKLDIKLILEAVDVETIAMARRLTLPGNVEVVVVPDLHPRTKPKAHNYASPVANISSSMTRRTGLSATSCAKPSPRSRAAQSCLPPGEARSL